MKISVHTHPESQLTGSPLPAMIKRAVDLGRTHFTYTDLGHLSSCLKAYGLAKKANLKFAAGLELYFKDPKCDVVVGTPADRCKYFTTTIFAKNQTAYQELVKIVSKTDMPKIKVQDEMQSLWGWDELTTLSKFDTLLVIGGVHCMVGKTLLADGPELAERVLLKAKSLFGSRLSVALICEPWDKKFATVIKIQYTDGTYDSVLASDSLSTDRARKIKALDLITRGSHKEILSKVVGNTHFEVNKKILDVTEHSGFLPLPLDATLEINRFLYEMAKKHSIKVLVSDYAFYAEKSDHIVQTMVLENTTKIKADLHMKTGGEFKTYLKNKMSLDLSEIQNILDSNDEWANNFDDFELKYEIRLADSGEVPALQQCMETIKKVGRMKWNNSEYTARLREEISVISQNGVKDLSGYFLPLADIMAYHRENGSLTGPARGSAGGSLLCFLMGITQVDPIRYGLSFPRFLSLDRIKNGDYPDVDCLAPDTLIKTKDGYVSIEYLSDLSESDYPEIAAFNGNINIWELPTAIFKKGEKEVFEYQFDNGSKLVCTEDHRVLTPNGWMEINAAYERGMDIKSFK